MGLADQPDTLARWMADMERRMRTQETATRAALTSITDAAGKELVRLDKDGIKIYDAAGLLRARFGYINASVGYGLSVFDAAGGLRFEVNDQGHRDPWLDHPWRPSTPLYVPVTSGTFVDVFECRVDLITHGGVASWVQWATDAGTTGEVRLLLAASTSSAVTLAAASSGVQQFKWLHGQALGTGPALFKIQARRTGGAGNVNIYPAAGCQMADPGACDADGIP